MYVESAKLVSRLRNEIGLDCTCTTQDLMDKYPHLKSQILGSTGLVEREDDRAKELKSKHEAHMMELHNLLIEWDRRRLASEGKQEKIRELMTFIIWKRFSKVYITP